MPAWSHWLPFVIVTPIVGGALLPALAHRRPAVALGWAIALMAATSFAAVRLTLRVAADGPFSYAMGGWAPPFGIELHFDEFSAVVVVVLCLIGTLVLVYSPRYVTQALPRPRVGWYYTLLLITLGGMIGFVSTGDLFNLFVFLEVFSLAAYALVAIGDTRRATLAAFKYLLMGAVGSLLVLLGVGLLYTLTGSLNLADVAARLGGAAAPPVAVALAALVAGMLVKAAVVPVHAWLPDAHAAAPSPVSAILSGLVVKMGVIGLLRVYPLFQATEAVPLAALQGVLVWLGGISIVVGALFAIVQDDLKLMLAYSTVSNTGYILLGLGLATPLAAMGGVVHVVNHAVIKATLFLAAGAIIHRTGYRTLADLRGIGGAMPATAIALSLGVLAIIGLPPTAGFLGKWYIVLGAFEAGQPVAAVVLVVGALLICVYYVRIVTAFHFHEPVHAAVRQAGEAPPSMLVPVLLLAVLCLVLGVLGQVPLRFIEPGVHRLLGP